MAVGEGEDETEKKGLKSESRKNPKSGRGKNVRGGSVTTTTDLTMSSDVWSAQSLCRRGGRGEGRAQQQGGEEESKRKRGFRGACAALL